MTLSHEPRLPVRSRSTAQAFLWEQRIDCGALPRVYANFDLHGDFRFAHEDGEGWTALSRSLAGLHCRGVVDVQSFQDATMQRGGQSPELTRLRIAEGSLDLRPVVYQR